MQGIILAGGTGTRLAPLSNGINKHLLPIGDHPMIAYSIKQLFAHPKIEGVKIVTGFNHVSQIRDGVEYLTNLGPINIIGQERPQGIGDAIRTAFTHVDIANAKDLCIILGDNLFAEPLSTFINAWKRSRLQGNSAMCLLGDVTTVHNPKALGLATLDSLRRISKFVEKPEGPINGHFVPGFYCFDQSLHQVLCEMKPSKRGEYEITDILSVFMIRKTLDYAWLIGKWIDCGTLEDYRRAQNFYQEKMI